MCDSLTVISNQATISSSGISLLVEFIEGFIQLLLSFGMLGIISYIILVLIVRLAIKLGL